MKPDKLISKVQIYVIIPDAPPLKYLADWLKSIKDSTPDWYKALEKAIPNFKAYLEKIVQPGIDALKKWIPVGYRSKHGRTYQDIINTAETNACEGYKRWQEKLKRLFETVDGEEAKRLHETLEFRAYDACLRAAQISMPFEGYSTEVRGVASFAARWLSGDETVKTLICDLDKDLFGGPVLITEPERAGEFRNEFIQRIKKAGSAIMKSSRFVSLTTSRFAEFIPPSAGLTTRNYDLEVIQAENDRTNELVNQFLADGFAKFTTDGESHIAFIVKNGLLYLDIQVSQI